jgi:hypothetical protein
LEDAERRSIAVSLTAAKLTGRTLAKALQAAMRKIQQERQNAQTPEGRQSVKKLMNHRVSTNAIPLDGDTRLFDRMARKYNVDYAFHKTGPKKYLLFFKAGQADAITQCFAEYTKRAMRKSRKQSALGEMGRHTEDINRKRPKEHEHKREAAHNDR